MRDLQLQKFHYVLIFHTFLHVVSASVWKFMLLQNDMWLLIIFLSLTKVCNPLQDLNLGIFDWQAAYTLWSMLKPCPRIFVILLFMNDIIEGNGGQSSILLNSETTICIEPGKVTIEETTASTYHKTNFRTFWCREHISIIANNNLTYSSLELAILSVYQVSFSTWII